MTTIDPLSQSYSSINPPTVGTFVAEKGGGHGIVVSTPFGPHGHNVYVRVAWLATGSGSISDSITLDARITNLDPSSAGEVYWISNRSADEPSDGLA
jgi:hypothetical protein